MTRRWCRRSGATWAPGTTRLQGHLHRTDVEFHKGIISSSQECQGKFATAANPLGFHVLAWTVPSEATPQPLPAKARTPNHFAQGRCRADTPMFGAGWWI